MGAEWATSVENQWGKVGGGRKGRDRKSNLVGGGGEAGTECLILWLVVLELLAGGWWWHGGCLFVKCVCPVHLWIDTAECHGVVGRGKRLVQRLEREICPRLVLG